VPIEFPSICYERHRRRRRLVQQLKWLDAVRIE
jgi:hypothetical protein